ncbi:NRPS-like enzyme [Aspergillus ibericus CBS 121593]|uniref:NRPS-like enzyme n=1 Tax=Aspergillus ibericus CBS 121593 TaxID=1448316 RepID=A0A395HD03_9EURO|nr:NRPS-like enzyme [Aspergillus ibericus CBS 121593]RAL05369.1 NRPS-like enzyme [Aspergillus ibericus CBS 121593]
MAPHVIEANSQTPGPELKEFAAKGVPATSSESGDTVQNLAQLLARASASTAGLTFYTSGAEATRVSYANLQRDAEEKARVLRRINGLSPSSIILLHFETNHDTLPWFWAATLAGFLPAISTPFVHDPAQRKKHLHHLQTLLQEPVILTTERLVPEFLEMDELRLHPVESLSNVNADSNGATCAHPLTGTEKKAEDAAVLMLTSGSTGSAKAVPLRHGQLLTALQGKKDHHGTESDDVFLTWVGLDHVASLCEVHLHAMSLGADQVHVPAVELLRNPLRFIQLLDSHQVAYTFAPNFFLTQVRDALTDNPAVQADLSRLKSINSGGEANVVATIDGLTRELRRFNIQREVISPGFGMTETCAGCVHAPASPSYDLAQGLEFASLGPCVPGVEMRVMRLTAKDEPAARGEVGELQLSGPAVFAGYFNNPDATAAAFTDDGWFITGDLAWLDESGYLNLAGRTRDTIIVNGVKWSATEIEMAIEEERIPGVVPSYTVAFPCRAPGSASEDIAIVYSPTYAADDSATRFETATAIAKTVALLTGRKPAHLIPLPAEMLDKSSLGKISRTKVRTAFEKGEYASMEAEDTEAVQRYREATQRPAKTETEKRVQSTVAGLLQLPVEEINVDMSIFDLGITSFNLILLKAMIQEAVDAPVEIPMSVLMTDPTTVAISAAIDKLLSQPPVYNPIVPLQPHGTKIPLFLIHPGSGDILVFIALAAQFPTRPVYALRTRGYNTNEPFFPSIQNTAETYAHHIRQTQPEGPYAIAGYSLGSTLAFEVGKVLEAQGQEVRFLASIDYPPHIRQYVRGQNWIDVLLHIAFFLELIDQNIMAEAGKYLHGQEIARQDALVHVLSISDQERVRALALNPERLERITDIGENFRVHGESYEPEGTVERLDVFVADPPSYAALNRQDWEENKLGAWRNFSRTEVGFYNCPGIHATMLNPVYVPEFVRSFKLAMKRRGV